MEDFLKDMDNCVTRYPECLKGWVSWVGSHKTKSKWHSQVLIASVGGVAA